MATDPERNPAVVDAPPPELSVIDGDGPETNQTPGTHEEDTGTLPTEPTRPARRHWSMDEQRTVAATIAGLMRKQGMRHIPDTSDRTGGRFMNDFLALGQRQLPPERRRAGLQRTTMGLIFWKLVEDALTNKLDQTPPVAPPAPTTTPEKQPAEATAGGADSTPPKATHPVPPAGYAIVNEADPLGKVPLRALLRVAFERMLETLDRNEARIAQLEQMQALVTEELGRVTNQFDNIMRQLADHATAIQGLPGVIRKGRTKVAIAGCDRTEFLRIADGAKEAGLELEFKHYHSDDSQFIAMTGEYCIILPRTRHSWREKAKVTYSPGKWMATDGNWKDAVDILKRWFKS